MVTLVYSISESIQCGGFADRITGMASLSKFASSLGAGFKIDHRLPFDFFHIFPDGRDELELQDLTRDIMPAINLIDGNFKKNAAALFSVTMNGIHFKDDRHIRVYINNVKPFYFDPLFNRVIFPRHAEAAELLADYERKVLSEFSERYLSPNTEVFGEEFNALLQYIKGRSTVGIQVRVGGRKNLWTDPDFPVPSIDEILFVLSAYEQPFQTIFISSDDLPFKTKLAEALSRWSDVKTLDVEPVHFERSSKSHRSFGLRSVGDHCLLANCSAGLICGGGGYGRTAAIVGKIPFRSLVGNR
jgi:hypothetical protein